MPTTPTTGKRCRSPWRLLVRIEPRSSSTRTSIRRWSSRTAGRGGCSTPGRSSISCARYAPTVDASTTVAPAIAEKYRQEFGLDPAVVLNCPEKMDLQPRPVDPGCIRLIHHGMAQRGRRLEIMIEAMALADPRYRLHLMLFGRPGLHRRASGADRPRRARPDHLSSARIACRDRCADRRVRHGRFHFAAGEFQLDGGAAQ